MNSRDHGLLSVGLALGIVGVAPPPAGAVPLGWDSIAIVLGVIVLGIGIDLDHFLLARLQTGSWQHTRRVLADPRLAVLDQEDIFEAGDVWREDRLFSHLVIGGVLAGGLWLGTFHYLAVVAALTVYVHVMADVYHDLRSREDYLVEGARVVTDGEP